MSRRQPEEPVRGLFRNGNLWWVRIRGPASGDVRRRSTGTDDVRVANAIATMIKEFRLDRTTGWSWLERVVRGEVDLQIVYAHRVRSALHELQSSLDARVQPRANDDLREWAKRWVTEVLPTRVSRRRRALSQRQQDDYKRQLLALIPDDQPVLCSELTEEYVTAALQRLEAKPNTQRNYVSAWRLFVRWARRKGAPIAGDPFEYAEEWLPGPGKPRNMVWSHRQRLAVLAELDGAAKAAVALMLGSGMELSALLRLRGQDVVYDDSHTVFADGSKTDYRSRYVTVDAWAWTIFTKHAPKVAGAKRVFPWSEATKGAALRESFYRAQVRAGLCEEPPKSEKGYSLWDQVEVHTLHDCRHTYAICRSLGLDGEASQTNEYLANQLGHANEVMVQRVYKSLSAARRRQLLAEAATLREATSAA